jgi:uncharacterized repeat protein (TIGR02543 family)
MKKFLQEVFTYFWIPLILALVSYVFFQLHDVILGIIILIALSAIYTIVRLYFLHKKWWLLIILVVVIGAATGYFFARSPASALTIDNTTVTGSSVSLTGGSVAISPSPQVNGKYTKGTKVTLTVSPAAGYDWKGWTGTDSDTSNPTTVIMNGNKHVTVTLESRPSLIINNLLVIGSVVSFTEGTVAINPVPGSDGKYTKDTKVTLTANPTDGYDWKSWSGTESDTSNPATVTLSSNKQITATFEPRISLTISNQLVIGSSVSFAEGSVTVSPAPGDDDKYAKGTKVTLTANPITGYGWKSWSGTGSDASNPSTVTLSSDKHVTVIFEQRYLLMVNNLVVTGPSTNITGGSVTLNPAPGADGRYTKDATITLTAIPAAGYRFDRWSGDFSSIVTSVTISINTNKNLSASFMRIYALTAAVSPAGGGAISPSSGTYDEGSNVILTATPASGYRFDHWSGDASGNINPLTINMNTGKSVTAAFVKVYSLTALVSPAGSGSVTPAGGTYDESANVTLITIPASGYRFDRWSGDVSGNTTSVNVIMNGNKNVTANFIKVYTLTVAVSPAGGGSVSSTGSIYDTGASVTITAIPATGYVFDHWGGDVSGNTTAVTITMTADKNVTAVFKIKP